MNGEDLLKAFDIENREEGFLNYNEFLIAAISKEQLISEKSISIVYKYLNNVNKKQRKNSNNTSIKGIISEINSPKIGFKQKESLKEFKLEMLKIR